jgi:hypothetical protein
MRWKEVMLVVDDARAVHLLAAVAAVWAGQGLTWSWPILLAALLLYLLAHFCI